MEKQTIYYQPEGLALEIFQKRYQIHKEETWQEACDRVAGHVATAETNGNILKWRETFSEYLKMNLIMPAGRIWYGSGRPKGQLLNCFVIPSKDSREGWGSVAYDTIVISGTGGGAGTNYSPVRPRGSKIAGSGGLATGAVSLMEGINAFGEKMKGGGGRRTALMMALNINHGDIVEFLDKKLDKKELNNANVSVIFDEDPEQFFALVKSDRTLELKHNGQVIGTASAVSLWKKIISNALKGGEPGLLNGYLANRMNNVWYFKPLICTNPCIAGDIKIAVADGRNAVSIKQLTEEGNDIPVYSTNVETGQVEIKMGRNPRVTGEKKEIWKLTIDDGSVLRATPNHKIMKNDRSYVELKDLKPGDSVFPFNTFNSNGYRQVCGTGAPMKGGARRNKRQYRLIDEFSRGSVDSKTIAIHHANFDSEDDRLENLMRMSHEDHRELHAERIRGDKNPYHMMSDEWKENFASHPGAENARFSGWTNEELLEEGREIFSKHGKLTQELWIESAKNKGFPQFLGNEFRFGTWTNFRNQVADNHKVVSVEFCGHEDVYNITVDDNHNYHVVTSGEDKKHVTSSGLCVKNCGEIWLVEYDCCDLGALVLPRFIMEMDGLKFNQINWAMLEKAIITLVRFLDNVLTVNNYPLEEIKETCFNIRRIGLGVMGLHDMLLLLGLKYNSDAGLEMIDKVMKFIKETAYGASIELAIEKGSFPMFDADKFLKSGFIKTLKPSIKSLIKKHGIRNCAILTIAPTGTTSMVSAVTSGIEPMFAPAYKRRYRDGDVLKEEIVVHPLLKEFHARGRSIDHFQGAYDLSIRDHFEVQRICQKHLDNACSKTINIPQGVSEEELSELYMEYLPELKGVTIYPEGSRADQPLTPLSLEEAVLHAEIAKISSAEGIDSCKSGACEI